VMRVVCMFFVLQRWRGMQAARLSGEGGAQAAGMGGGLSAVGAGTRAGGSRLDHEKMCGGRCVGVRSGDLRRGRWAGEMPANGAL
jgi:hypothetical protein